MAFKDELQNHFRDAASQLSSKFLSFVGQPLLVLAENTHLLQEDFSKNHAQLILNLFSTYLGKPQAPLREVIKGDRRFTAPAWQSPFFNYLRQAYYINCEFINKTSELISVKDDDARARLRFITKQYLDALSPTNLLATNPVAIDVALKTHGGSLQKGAQNLFADLQKGRISMSDESVFAVGKNLAVTPGAVVFKNELIELIQYVPSGKQVYERPLLMVPPCINKYYILDLQIHNSFVRYAVERGFNVFLISWRNADSALRMFGWDDYLRLGPLAAIEVVLDITNREDLNALGFCVGGTILSSALGVLAAQGKSPAHALTLLTTLLDFTDTGEIGKMVHEPLVKSFKNSMGQGGIYEGEKLASVFSSLRPNELIWQYVSGNYLQGITPQPMDLLYWNSDAANLAGPFMCQYLEHMYLQNKLKDKRGLVMCGEFIDLRQLKMPTFIYASREDHIVPWRAAYASRDIVSGETIFVLGASGHIAGVINPPSQNKRHFWTCASRSKDADEWLANAQKNPGSWWPTWIKWLIAYGGGKVRANPPGSPEYPSLEPAPGSYVRVRC